MINTQKIINNILGKRNIVKRKIKQKSIKRLKQNNISSLKYIYIRDPDLEIAMIKAVEHKEKPIATIYIEREKELGFKTKLSFLMLCTPSGYSNEKICDKVYYRPETKDIALKFIKLTEYQFNPNNKNPFSNEFHREAGKLLGYPEKVIEPFINLVNKSPEFFSNETSTFEIENVSLNILNIVVGTKWIGCVILDPPDSFLYLSKRDMSNKIFNIGRKRNKLKVLTSLPYKNFKVIFVLPNVSNIEFKYQNELLMKKIDIFRKKK